MPSPPDRSFSQQLADAAAALVAGALELWRAGARTAPPGGDAVARPSNRHEDHGMLLPTGELRLYQHRLHLERIQAPTTRVTDDAAYRAQLEDEIAECRSALVGAIVIDIARRRAQAVGRHVG